MTSSLLVDTSRLAPNPHRSTRSPLGVVLGGRSRSKGKGKQVETVAEEDAAGEGGWDDLNAVGVVGGREREEEGEGEVPDTGFKTLIGNVYKTRMGK